jgi:hypothetical protein
MLGDSDFVSGVFFKDFGVPVLYGTQMTVALLDNPSSSEHFGSTRVELGGAVIKIGSISLDPMPKPKDTITVNGRDYTVQERTYLDDGGFTEFKLKGPQ